MYRLARLNGFDPVALSHRLEALHVAEIGQSQLTARLGLAIGVARGDDTGFADGHARQVTGGVAVLGQIGNGKCRAVLRRFADIQGGGERANIGVGRGDGDRECIDGTLYLACGVKSDGCQGCGGCGVIGVDVSGIGGGFDEIQLHRNGNAL